jgi:enoyl-CoA hydratase
VRRVLPEPVRRYMLLTGRHVSAEYLAQFGAVSLIVEDDALDAEAMAIAQEIAAYDPMVVRAMKASVEQLKDLDVKTTYAMEHTWSGLMRAQRQAAGIASTVDDYMGRFKNSE